MVYFLVFLDMNSWTYSGLNCHIAYMSYLMNIYQMKLMHLLLLIDWYFLLTYFKWGEGHISPPLPESDNFLPTYLSEETPSILKIKVL